MGEDWRPSHAHPASPESRETEELGSVARGWGGGSRHHCCMSDSGFCVRPERLRKLEPGLPCSPELLVGARASEAWDFPGRCRGAGSVTLSDKGPSVPIRAPCPQALGHEAPRLSAEEGPVGLWVLTARAWASVGACVTEGPGQFLIPPFLAHYAVRRSWGFFNWN